MNPIQAIAGTIAKTIQDALTSAAAQGAQALQKMNLGDDSDQDDDSQIDGPAEASNTLLDSELARIQAMLAQAASGQQNNANSHGANGGGQSFGGMRA